MKKLTLLAVAALGLFAVASADAQTDSTTTTTTTRTTSRRATVSARNNAALNARLRRIESQSGSTVRTATPQGRIDGSVTRAARSGNPLQMVNPLAPKEYGDGSDVTRHEPDDPYQRPQGLRLFAVQF